MARIIPIRGARRIFRILSRHGPNPDRRPTRHQDTARGKGMHGGPAAPSW